MALLALASRLLKGQKATDNARRFGDSEPFTWVWQDREDQFARNRAMLENAFYLSGVEGGFLEEVLDEVFGLRGVDADGIRIGGNYNPVRNIVDAYQNVFRGKWGREIKPADEVDGEPINPALPEALRSVWRWSNLDTQKQVMQEWAANLGTVGLRIVAKADPDPAQRRVSIQIDHPGTIVDFDEDDRGNVTAVLLRWNALFGDLGERRRDVKVEELITKDKFVRSINGRKEETPNDLGVCPYVILRHRDDGHEFGRWAYAGSEQIIHQVNWLIGNQGDSIVEHIWPTWFATAGGNAPENFQFGRQKVSYVKTNPDTPPPSLAPLVAALDQQGTREFWLEIISTLMERQPELLISALKALSGQSGETIAKLLIPAEAKIEHAKANYEHALKRALQIGLSEGVRLGLWDLGTGRGTAEAAERAYSQGLEEFEFAPRRPLPETVYDRIQEVTANDAESASKIDLMGKAESVTSLSRKEVLRIGGYTDEQIRAIEDEKQAEDSSLEDGTGTDTLDGNGQDS